VLDALLAGAVTAASLNNDDLPVEATLLTVVTTLFVKVVLTPADEAKESSLSLEALDAEDDALLADDEALLVAELAADDADEDAAEDDALLAELVFFESLFLVAELSALELEALCKPLADDPPLELLEETTELCASSET